MDFFRSTTAFFCAATFLTAAATLSRADDATIYNLSGGEDTPISAGSTLTVVQEIDGVYSGGFVKDGEGDGAIAVVKEGSGNLLLTGDLGALGGITLSEGALTLHDGVSLPESQFAITSSATLNLSMNSDSDALSQLVVSDENRVGTVNNIGGGTVLTQQLSGNVLNVNAGTLIVSYATTFNRITVSDGAELRVGSGENSAATLTGDIALEHGATLAFDRDLTSGTFYYSDSISGEGDVVFDGACPVYFNGNDDQTYTGTTTINAGGMIFSQTSTSGEETVSTPKLSSREIVVNAGGVFGGNVTASGSVVVNGTEFSSVSDWNAKVGENTFGNWQAGAGFLFADGGSTLTIDGDLTIAATEIEYTIDYEEMTIDYSGNSGGAVQIHFDGNGAGKIVANGNVSLGGTLVLSGASGLEVGQRAVIFESDPAKTTGDFDQIVYGSDNVVLLSPGVGGIREGQYGIASVENRNVRKRASFTEHKGLENFVDYLVSRADEPDKIAQAVAIADAGSVTDVVNNFSALSYTAFAEMAASQSGSELDMLLAQIARERRNPPASTDGVRVEKNFSFFSGLLTDFVHHESSASTPVYDFDSLGVYAGGQTWIDDERAAGFTLAMHHSAAQPHGNGGSLTDDALRARVFAVFAPKFSAWFLTVGGSFGVHYYDIERKTALGTNRGDTPGVDVGLFAALNYREEIEPGLFFTPYLRFEYNFVYVGSVDESGSDSRLNVDHINFSDFRARFGSGFEYAPGHGKTFGVDFGFIAAFGRRADIASEFAAYDNSRTTIKGDVGEKMNFEIAPHFSVELGDGWIWDAAYRFQTSFSGSLGHSFDIGIGKRF